MSRRWKVVVRFVGGLLFALTGYLAGSVVYVEIIRGSLLDSLLSDTVMATFVARGVLTSVSLALFAFAIGYVITPTLMRPLEAVYHELREVPPLNLLGATVGLAVGLGLSALTTIPLSSLPQPFGQVLPFILAIVLGFLGTATVGSNPEPYLGFLKLGQRQPGSQRQILLDTSVLIDGRVADVAETGFLAGTLTVPRFVLNELQQVADSADAMRRNRGRRGLEVLNRLQQSERVVVELSDTDMADTDDVDRKLLRLAEELHCAVMTNDYNLNRVAEIQGVEVLNLNELTNAVKTIVLPGESLAVRIIQEGKETGQGVGYLDDGTMVVVEQGRDYLEETLPVTVTRVLQTVAGRMIFATLSPGEARE